MKRIVLAIVAGAALLGANNSALAGHPHYYRPGVRVGFYGGYSPYYYGAYRPYYGPAYYPPPAYYYPPPVYAPPPVIAPGFSFSFGR